MLKKPITHEVLVRSQVINVAIYGDVPERTLKELAVEAKNELLAYDEISQINLAGVRDYEIAIHVSEEALLQYGLSLEEIAALVARNCVDVPAGTLKTQREELTLRTKGQKYNAQEFEDLVIIAHPDGTLVTLGQIAQVTDGFEDDIKFGRFQGSPAAILEVYKTTNQDTSTIARIVRDYVAKKQSEIPNKARNINLGGQFPGSGRTNFHASGKRHSGYVAGGTGFVSVSGLQSFPLCSSGYTSILCGFPDRHAPDRANPEHDNPFWINHGHRDYCR